MQMVHKDKVKARAAKSSTSQPIEISSPVREQPLQLQGEDQDNPSEETWQSGEEQRNELGLTPTPSMSPQGDLLHDFEFSQVLANMSAYMQQENLLNVKEETIQSPENTGNTEHLSPLREASLEAEINEEASQETVHQSGDTLPVENSQICLATESIGHKEEVET